MNIALFALALIIFLIAYMLFRTSRLSKFRSLQLRGTNRTSTRK
jgi:hypothetical protein